MGDSNPFIFRGPVRDPAFFFGRKQETSYLFDLLKQGQSVSIHGPRRFGKTSLVFFAANAQTNQTYGLDPNVTTWVYLEGGLLDGLGEEWLYGAIDHAIGAQVQTLTYSALLERAHSLARDGRRLIVILDEFELIASNQELESRVFNRLRGLAQEFSIQYVVVSKEPLANLYFAYPEVLSSPFFNIFAPLRLGPFSEFEAYEMLSVLSVRAGRPFDSDTIKFLIALVGYHPLFLQVAGYRAFAALANGSMVESDNFAKQVMSDLEGHLTYYWSLLEPRDQRLLASMPVTLSEEYSEGLDRLDRAGMLSDGRSLPEVIRRFVERQTIDGLLRCGPFALDDNHRLLTIDGEQCHLTPTEFALMRLFLQRPGEILTPELVESVLWPDEFAPDPERARGIVKKLRAALGTAGASIVNKRGEGYVLKPS